MKELDMRDVLVVDSVRTGLAKSFRGSFNWTRSDDMAAFLIDALIHRNPQFDPDEVEDVSVCELVRRATAVRVCHLQQLVLQQVPGLSRRPSVAR